MHFHLYLGNCDHVSCLSHFGCELCSEVFHNMTTRETHYLFHRLWNGKMERGREGWESEVNGGEKSEKWEKISLMDAWELHFFSRGQVAEWYGPCLSLTAPGGGGWRAISSPLGSTAESATLAGEIPVGRQGLLACLSYMMDRRVIMCIYLCFPEHHFVQVVWCFQALSRQSISICAGLCHECGHW